MFKTKASKIEKALKDKFPDIDFRKLDKPRKGSFVIKVSGSEAPIVNLLDMPRPFTKLRELDLDATVQTILEKIE